MKTITVKMASNESLKGLGKYISVEAQEIPDAQNEIQSYRGQLAIMESDSIQIGICVAKNRAYVVDTLEQHAQSSELLVALNGDFVTPVAPSIKIDGKIIPDMDKVVAIRVNNGEGVVFDEGIWHWTPYAITKTCNVLVAFKLDTPANDFIAFNLDEKIMIEL